VTGEPPTVVDVVGAPPLEAGRCRVIAEAGVNHNNSIERALELVRQAKAAGAWGVKFQLYKAGSLAQARAPKYWSDAFDTATQLESFSRSDHLDYQDYAVVADEAKRLGIVFFATPFDLEALVVLEELGVPLHKVASGDITNEPLLRELARTNKPIVLSTGASSLEEIHRAVAWLGGDPKRIVLLACTLTYPTPDEDANFARVTTLQDEFSPMLVGVSDHTLGTDGGWMAGALGAVCLEKHYTLDKSLPDSPDHAMGVDPDELAELVAHAERAALLRGSSWVGVRESERPARLGARRSLVAARPLEAGRVLERSDLVAKRPGGGLAPFELDRILGRSLHRAVDADEELSLGDLVASDDERTPRP
jgi:sialic acid synthase SpsE